MDEPIRIALVCTSLNQLGGRDNHLKNIYLNLDKSQFKVCIFCCTSLENEFEEFMKKGGVNQEDMILLSRVKKRLILPFIWELRNNLRDKKIGLVHTFQLQSDIFGVIAARLAGIKYIFSSFESKIIDDNIPWLKQVFYRLIGLFIKGQFLKTIVVSEGLKSELISSGIRPKDDIKMIHLGFRIPEKYKNYEFSFEGLKRGRPIIGTIARLDIEKGLKRFIRAMPLVSEKLPGARFLIMGRGEEEGELRDMIHRLNLESKATFVEWSREVYPILESLDIFVMPSMREGCPHSLLEALALCRPVVASKIEGIMDIIEDGKQGLLVDTADKEAFARTILFLCENPEKAILLGKNGYKKISSEFTVEKEMSELEHLYLDAIR